MSHAKLNLMLVSARQEELDGLGQALGELVPAQQAWAAGAEQALSLAGSQRFQLVVIGRHLDMDPLELAAKLLQVDAFINAAVVSDEPEDEFHERSEGLGILTQLPSPPGAGQAKALIAQLKAIAAIP